MGYDDGRLRDCVWPARGPDFRLQAANCSGPVDPWRDATPSPMGVGPIPPAAADDKELLLSALDLLEGWTWDWNFEAGTLCYSPGWERSLGYEPSDGLISESLLAALVHPDDWSGAKAATAAHLRGETERYEAQYRMRASDGSWRWLSDRGRVVARDERGRARRMVGVRVDVTAQQEAERRLTESRDLLQSVIDGAGEPIFVKDREGRYLVVNDATARLCGIPRADMIGLREGDFMPAAAAERVEAHDRQVLLRGETLHVEEEVEQRGGSPSRIYQSTKAPWMVNGEIAGIIGVTRDVTEHLAAEAALRASETRLRAIVEATPECVKIVDADGRLLHMNPAGLAMIGAHADADLSGADVAELVVPEDRSEWRRRSGKVLAGKPQIWSFDIIGMQGTRRHMETHAVPLPMPDGSTAQLAITRDISERRQAEEALRLSEAQLSTIFSQAMVGIALVDADTGIVLANDRLCELLGRSAAELKGMTQQDVTHPEDVERLAPLYARAITDSEPFIAEKRYLRPDGTVVWGRASIAFVPETGGAPLGIVVVEDISDRKEAEAKLQRLQSELIHVSRVSAMGAMGTTIAHELNQPLAAISNYASALELFNARGGVAPEKLAELISLLKGQALRAGEIIRRLRSLVANGQAMVAVENLGTLVEEANVLALVGAREAGVSCRIDIAPELWVRIDKVQVQQLLFNLVRNAVEAMDGGARRKLVIAARRSGADALVCVEDTGPGLPDVVRASLFAPFVTTKLGGMGVGLSICRAIVEAQGGRIWVEEVPRGGTRFCFTLPAAEPHGS